MLTIRDIGLDGPLGTWVALLFAKDCIHVWERAYPEGKTPHNAIKATEKWLISPSEKIVEEAASASKACYLAVSELRLKQNDSITNAIYAAADAAGAAASGPYFNINNRAYHALEASRAAATALGKKNSKAYTHLMLSKHLSFIIDYKIKHRESFRDFEKVLESASEEDKEKLLFNLDLNKR
jgi:hypothetical protein